MAGNDTTSTTESTSLDVDQLMAAFIAGWRAPHAHAWDDLLAEDVELLQPLLPDRRGRHALADEYGRLLELMPDLHGEVDHWAHRQTPDGTRIVVTMQLRARVGRRELRMPVTDTLTLDHDGRISARRAHFPAHRAVLALAAAPSTWPRWWRSGVAPLTTRRALTDRWHRPDRPTSAQPSSEVHSSPDARRAQTSPTRIGLHDVLALGRLALAVAAWAAPARSARLVGLDPTEPAQRYLLRVFAGRAAALGLGSLTTSGPARRRWHQLGLLVDTSDTLAGTDPRLGTRARRLTLILTGTYATLGTFALRAKPEF